MQNKDEEVKYSTICEQGDLGLFGEVLSEADNELVKNQIKKQQENNK